MMAHLPGLEQRTKAKEERETKGQDVILLTGLKGMGAQNRGNLFMIGFQVSKLGMKETGNWDTEEESKEQARKLRKSPIFRDHLMGWPGGSGGTHRQLT